MAYDPFARAPVLDAYGDPSRALLVPQLLAGYDPQEAAFRAAVQPVSGYSVYRPGQGFPSQPATVGPALTTPTYNDLIQQYGSDGAQSNSGMGPAAPGPGPNDVQSTMGPMSMMSPEAIGLGLATNVMGPAGIVGTIGQIANAIGPAANISPQAMAIGLNPDAMQGLIALMDPSGSIAIAPPTDSQLFEAVVAQQHAASGGTAVGPQASPVAASPVDAPDTSIGTGVTGGTGASADGNTVICTELWKRGYIDEGTYALDTVFGRMQAPEVIAGYHRWAIPYVRLMRRSDAIGALCVFVAVLIARPWAKAMAAEVRRERGPIVGRLLMAVGRPVCGWLGKGRVVRVGGVVCTQVGPTYRVADLKHREWVRGITLKAAQKVSRGL